MAIRVERSLEIYKSTLADPEAQKQVDIAIKAIRDLGEMWAAIRPEGCLNVAKKHIEAAQSQTKLAEKALQVGNHGRACERADKVIDSARIAASYIRSMEDAIWVVNHDMKKAKKRIAKIEGHVAKPIGERTDRFLLEAKGNLEGLANEGEELCFEVHRLYDQAELIKEPL